ncbi:MAG: hypothetical protein ACD_49C00030G0009 [uncultured bacterium (gcode 4)]|uniref:Uncharacterized protein n=1 Tax=uncultured bacterium (gcode 4) TaxID=1234023 RepID=K2AXS7_9BACT|nr:MAG: hypothetical protein ACD_49C00030G0009 [uncultured bacterium (gcode 4)]
MSARSFFRWRPVSVSNLLIARLTRLRPSRPTEAWLRLSSAISLANLRVFVRLFSPRSSMMPLMCVFMMRIRSFSRETVMTLWKMHLSGYLTPSMCFLISLLNLKEPMICDIPAHSLPAILPTSGNNLASMMANSVSIRLQVVSIIPCLQRSVNMLLKQVSRPIRKYPTRHFFWK